MTDPDKLDIKKTVQTLLNKSPELKFIIASEKREIKSLDYVSSDLKTVLINKRYDYEGDKVIDGIGILRAIDFEKARLTAALSTIDKDGNGLDKREIEEYDQQDRERAEKEGILANPINPSSNLSKPVTTGIPGLK